MTNKPVPTIVEPTQEQLRTVLNEFEKTHYFNQGALHGLARVLYWLDEMDRQCIEPGKTEYSKMARMIREGNVLR